MYLYVREREKIKVQRSSHYEAFHGKARMKDPFLFLSCPICLLPSMHPLCSSGTDQLSTFVIEAIYVFSGVSVYRFVLKKKKKRKRYFLIFTSPPKPNKFHG